MPRRIKKSPPQIGKIISPQTNPTSASSRREDLSALQWGVYGILAVGLFLVLRHSFHVGGTVLGLALLLQIWVSTGALIPSIGPWQGNSANRSVWVSILVWIAFSLVQLTFPSFSWLVPFAHKLPFHESYLALAILWLGLVVSLRTYPRGTDVEDFSPITTRALLLITLIAGVVLRFHDGSEPMGAYWDDEAAEVANARRVADLGDFHDAFVFPNPGNMEPLYSYVMIALFKLFPRMSSLTDQRLASVLIDLGALVCLYLIGKELRNRRTGIWAAALGAVSKVMVMKSQQGMRIMALSLAASLALLVTIRLFKKPSLSRFLQWGVGFGLGLYTYSTIRSDTPLILLGVLAWVLWKGWRQPSWPKYTRAFLVGTGLLYAGFILYTNNVFHGPNVAQQALQYGGFLFPALLLAIYLLMAYELFLEKPSSVAGTHWLGWLLGSWVGVLLLFAFLCDPGLSGRIAASLHIQSFLVRLQEERVYSWAFALGIPFLTAIRVAQRPSTKGHLLLGVIVALTGALVPAHAPWTAFALLFPFPAVWTDRKHGAPLSGLGLLLGGHAVLFTLLFLHHADVLGPDNGIAWLIDFNPYWMPCWVLALALIGSLRVLRKGALIDAQAPYIGYLSGAWLFIFLTFPVAADPTIMARIVRQNPATSANAHHYFLQVWDKVQPALKIMFWSGFDRTDMHLPFDALFSYPETILIALGLAFFLVRPNWIKFFILAMAVMGVVPYIGTEGPHTGRITAVVVPLLVLGALGFEDLACGVESLKRIYLWRFFLAVSFLFLCWTGYHGTSQRVFGQWMHAYFEKHVLYRSSVLADQDLGRVTYISSSLSGGDTSSVLYEGHPVHQWGPLNRLFLSPGVPTPDISIYVQYGDRDEKNLLQRYFPAAQWSDIFFPNHNSSDTPAIQRCFIPSESLHRCSLPYGQCNSNIWGESCSGLLQVCSIPSKSWHRRFSSTHSGLTFGVIDWEDWVTNVNEPIAPWLHKGGEGVIYQGIIEISKDATYETTLETDNKTVLTIDGHKIIDALFPFTYKRFAKAKTIKKQIHLSQGKHQVQVLGWLQHGDTAPDIRLRARQGPAASTSIWSLIAEP